MTPHRYIFLNCATSSKIIGVNRNKFLVLIRTDNILLYGCETWSVILVEEHRLRVSENRVLWRIFGSKREEVTGEGEYYITRNFMICNPHQILLALSNQDECDEQGMWHVWRRGEVYTGFWWGNPEGQRPL